MAKYIKITKAAGGEPYYFLADNIKFVEQTSTTQVKVYYWADSSSFDQLVISVTNGPSDYISLKDAFISEFVRIMNTKGSNPQDLNLTFGGGENFAVSSVALG